LLRTLATVQLSNPCADPKHHSALSDTERQTDRRQYDANI